MSDDDKCRRMSDLARSFPSLAERFHVATSCGLDPWRPERLARCCETWAFAEQQIAAFLLTVWNSRQSLVRDFSLVDAMARWSEGDREALIAWSRRPFAF